MCRFYAPRVAATLLLFAFRSSCGGGGSFVAQDTTPPADGAPSGDAVDGSGEDDLGPEGDALPPGDAPDDAAEDAAPDVPDVAPPHPCAEVTDCAADLGAPAACRVWACVDDGCVEEAELDGASCDDGRECTDGDSCAAGSCAPGPPLDCDDGNPCTDDDCDDAVGCSHTPSDRSCDDGDPCTVLDACLDGTCSGMPSAEACPCADDDACETHDDGDPCNGRYVCRVGGCVAEPPRVCNQAGLPACEVAVCDPGTGACVTSPAPAGTACDDGAACTSDDVCTDGVCAGTPSGCPCLGHDDCVELDDGDRCNGIFRCFDGQCAFDAETIIVCAQPTGACRENVCVPETGVCQESDRDDGVGCDEGDACTEGATCTGGVCGGGQAVQCDDGNVCTHDRCDVYFGCLTELAPLDCDDADPCTTADRCVAGACVGFPVDCDDGNLCTADECSDTLGCIHLPLTGDCSDGNPCTDGDACFDGVCASGPVEACGSCVTDVECFAFEDGDLCNGVLKCIEGLCRPDPATIRHCDDPVSACQVRVCNPETGQCDTRPRTDGLPCDDGNPCTWGGFCSLGICVANSNPCDDGNPCTTDSCRPSDGCSYLPASGNCNDGNRCTAGDQCAFGVCRPGAHTGCPECATDADCVSGDDLDVCNGVIACVDSRCVLASGSRVTCPAPAADACLAATCDATTGACGTELLPEASPCDDGDVCSADDRCTADGACAGADIDCDDGNPCTDDSCDPDLGCRHAPNAVDCDDDNPCTQLDRCVAGACTGGDPVRCDDGDPCTNDLCQPDDGSCSFVENAAPCDDGSACTAADTCRFGECVGIPVSCDDGNPCTDDLCDPGLGCLHNYNTAGCDDGQPCTVLDHCDNGLCLSGPLACHEICGNGVDDDDDGLADCLDQDCAPLPSCMGVGVCEPVGEIGCLGHTTGDLGGEGTTNQVNSFSCAPGDFSGPEIAWTYTADCDGVGHAIARVQTADHPTRPRVTLFLVAQNALGNCVASTDCVATGLMVYMGDVGQAEALFLMEEGRTYYVVADAQAGATPDFSLDFICYCGGM